MYRPRRVSRNLIQPGEIPHSFPRHSPTFISFSPVSPLLIHSTENRPRSERNRGRTFSTLRIQRKKNNISRYIVILYKGNIVLFSVFQGSSGPSPGFSARFLMMEKARKRLIINNYRAIREGMGVFINPEAFDSRDPAG